jgi:hypothetical protein
MICQGAASARELLEDAILANPEIPMVWQSYPVVLEKLGFGPSSRVALAMNHMVTAWNQPASNSGPPAGG